MNIIFNKNDKSFYIGLAKTIKQKNHKKQAKKDKDHLLSVFSSI